MSLPELPTTIRGLEEGYDFNKRDALYGSSKAGAPYFRQLYHRADQFKGEKPIFPEFPSLHRLNILYLQNELAKMKAHFEKPDSDVQGDALPKLTSTLREYTQAIQDLEYIYRLNKAPAKEEKMTKGAFTAAFDKEIPNTGFNTPYVGFPDAFLASRQEDVIREFLRNNLHRNLAWPKDERKQKQTEYFQREPPDGYSSWVNLGARLLVAFAAAAWLIVPIIIMTVPSASSKTKDLIVLSVATILFGVALSSTYKSTLKDQDILAATAAYAAVLVVFYGNLVNTSGQSTTAGQTGNGTLK